MKKNLSCIMLIDDNADDNFYHEREIKKANTENIVITKNSGAEAMDYLQLDKDPHSDLIFLDINMPGMNGWEFLSEYNNLDKKLQSRAIIIMLTTSDNEDDVAKAKSIASVTDFITKPLTRDKMMAIAEKYFDKVVEL